MNPLQKLRQDYEAELAKANGDPVKEFETRFAWGRQAEDFDYESYKELHAIDWAGSDPLPMQRRAPPEKPERYSATDDLSAYSNDMEADYRERYGALPTQEQLMAAAQGFTQDDIMSEHGRELLFARAAKLAGHKRGGVTEQMAEVFSGTGPKGQAAASRVPATQEEANAEWIREFNQVRSQ